MKIKISVCTIPFLLAMSLHQGCSEEPEITSEVSYQNDIAPITSTVCAGVYCHTPIDQMTTYDGLKAVVDNGLLWQKVIETEEMPPDSESITEEQRGMITAWINDGAPNN